jgi:hypothetical protein
MIRGTHRRGRSNSGWTRRASRKLAGRISLIEESVGLLCHVSLTSDQKEQIQ